MSTYHADAQYDATGLREPISTYHADAQYDATGVREPMSTYHSDAQYHSISCKDSYLLFRNKYLVSNVVNTRPEDSRPLHSYKLKVQGTTIIGMLDSGAQINCVSQHIVQEHKFPGRGSFL